MTRRPDPVAEAMSAAVAAGAMPGAAWWVGGPDRTIAHGATGLACLRPERVSATEQTPYDLASLTKPLSTALLAVLLDRERRLPLEGTLGAAVPPLRSSAYAAATLKDAAAHRAGFPAWRALYLEGEGRDATLAAIARAERGASPGETLYSDLGYIALGCGIERVAGAPLDRLFDERIAKPLGLARTGFAGRSDRFRDAAATEDGNAYERTLAGADARDDRFRSGMIRGSVHDGNAWGLGGVAGHAGLFGTAEEVGKIALAILEPRRLGRPAGALDPMLHPAAGPGTRTVGFLQARGTESVAGILPDDAVGHFGFTGTSVWLDPHAGWVYVLLTNRVHPAVPAGDFVAVRRAFHSSAVAAARNDHPA